MATRLTETTDVTIGMRLDELISSIDTIPSTQLYMAVVVVSVIFSFLLLNSGGTSIEQEAPPSSPPSTALKKITRQGPEPKWHILKILNYAAVSSFLVSVGCFASDASRHMNDSSSLFKFLFGWSFFLCYFFGFFGISFVDADEIMEGQNFESSERSTSSKSKAVHPPAESTPVCTVPSSFEKPSLSKTDLQSKSNEELSNMVLTGQIKDHQLEKLLDHHRAVDVRRLAFDSKLSSVGCGGALTDLPSGPSLDYSRVFGANCEIVVGYVPLPVGMVGPLTLNGQSVYIPMATTEGCLVASTNRGCKAITQGSGATSVILRDGITRAPCVRMNSAKEAAELKLWCEMPANFATLKHAFESTTGFGKLLSVEPTVAGKNAYLRLQCFAGDAMGMNMVSKGSLAVIDLLKSVFPTLVLVALSGNMCTDKKAAATNWIHGRGKSVVVEAIIPQHVVRTTLKTTVQAIVQTNIHKNLIGSAMAGAIGGFNAHAANNVTAVFLATGQDPAQNVESSNCITLLEETEDGDLWICCTMPSIEVGTVGGGTSLPAQSACLKAIGCKGGGVNPGDNAKQLAHVVAAATMAGELSLLAALAANTLVQAHMTHNRKPTTAKST